MKLQHRDPRQDAQRLTRYRQFFHPPRRLPQPLPAPGDEQAPVLAGAGAAHSAGPDPTLTLRPSLAALRRALRSHRKAPGDGLLHAPLDACAGMPAPGVGCPAYAQSFCNLSMVARPHCDDDR